MGINYDFLMRDISGSTHLKELQLLAEYVIRTKHDIIEVGSMQGRSALAIIGAMEDIDHKGTLWLVDPVVQFGCDLYTAGKIHPNKNNLALIKNLGDLNSLISFKIINTEFENTAQIFKDKKIDLVFIDGNHFNGAPLADAKLADSFIKPGGHIAMHDSNLGDVQLAISWLNANGYTFSARAESMSVFEKEQA